MVKVVVIGAGGMAKVHLSNYEYIDNAEVIALVGSTDSDRAVAESKNLKFYDNLMNLLEIEDFDIVDITTPTFTHYEIAKIALENNKSVICEKPFTLKVEDAKYLFDLASLKGCFIYVGQVVRFAKESKILKEIVEDQRFGKVLDGEFNRLSSFPFWNKNGWFKDRNKSGLVPFDLHIHDLDLIIDVFGKPRNYEVYGSGRKEIEYSEFYRFTYDFGDFKITSQASWYNSSMPFSNNWRVVFENAVLIFDGSTLVAYPPDKEKIVYDIKDEVIVPTSINLPPTGWFYNELSDFVNSYENKRNSLIVKNDQIISVLEILNTI